jgi:hypothetical protein
MTPSGFSHGSGSFVASIGALVDPNTAEYIAMAALAVDPFDGELYGYEYSGKSQLYKISKLDASVTRIGPVCECRFAKDMSFDSWGQLYVSSHTNKIYKVDKENGECVEYMTVPSLASDRISAIMHLWDDELFVTSYLNGKGDLYHITNKTTGQAELIMPSIFEHMSGGDTPPYYSEAGAVFTLLHQLITVETFNNPKKVIAQLSKQIKMAHDKAVEDGKPNAAAGIIDGVISKIENYVAEEKLSASDGDEIIDALVDLQLSLV